MAPRDHATWMRRNLVGDVCTPTGSTIWGSHGITNPEIISRTDRFRFTHGGEGESTEFQPS